MADFATEQGHWYAKDGSPRYTIVGKNGKERPTTLRDARPAGLLPSVTTIINSAAKPALEAWKRRQVLLAGLTLPRLPDEAESDWLARVEQDWQEEGKKAAEKGTAIHAAIEKHYRGEPTEEYWEWVKAAKEELERVCGPEAWAPERSFACSHGYGGKTDLHSPAWVNDIKSKEGGLEEAPALYDEHYMQLAAYRQGLGVPEARCGILFVSRDKPVARLIEADPEKLERGWKMFLALLLFWSAKNSYAPAP